MAEEDEDRLFVVGQPRQHVPLSGFFISENETDVRFHPGANSDGPQVIPEACERFLMLNNDVER
ncbi:hypothetical protein GCM10012278_23900 [Nonomuraea glycinis]|uniref:Uncharacterized protein n=1 Tax=Nonomuraea glycinis TaxID=2047744 RepID=A0A918A619_9ACTN|nr:hypothetical protein GCM10012278_23900 [Nonomuraea glycinis]